MASEAVTARDAAQGVQTSPMRRHFSAAFAIVVAVVAVLLASLAAGTHGVRAAVPSEGPPSAGGAPASPNVVVILTDDEPALDGRLMNTMPNARELFREHGITFTDFHVETSLCCPARAGYLTGQHTHNHGVTKNLARLFNPVMSLATALHDAGYYTGLVGKYLNEYGRLAPAVPPGWDRWVAFGDAKYYDYDLWIDGNPVPETHGDTAEDYATDVISTKAVALIRSAPRDQPLFLWVAPNAPHVPTWQVAPRYRNAPCAVPRWRPPNYDEFNVIDKPLYIRKRRPIGGKGKELRSTCRQLLAVDDLVGAVRDELAARDASRTRSSSTRATTATSRANIGSAAGRALPTSPTSRLRWRGPQVWGRSRARSPSASRTSTSRRLSAPLPGARWARTRTARAARTG